MINTIKIFTINKALSQHIVKGQRNKLTLHEGYAFKIDKDFFKAFNEKEVPYIYLRTTKDFSKHMVIDPKNRSFIQYLEDLEADHKWQISYNEASSSYKLVSVDKQNPNLCNAYTFFEPLPPVDCIINDKLEVLPLGSVNTEES